MNCAISNYAHKSKSSFGGQKVQKFTYHQKFRLVAADKYGSSLTYTTALLCRKVNKIDLWISELFSSFNLPLVSTIVNYFTIVTLIGFPYSTGLD